MAPVLKEFTDDRRGQISKQAVKISGAAMKGGSRAVGTQWRALTQLGESGKVSWSC